MKGIVKALVLSVFAMLVLAACTNNNDIKKEEAADNGPQSVVENKSAQQPSTEAEHPGKAVYTQYCLACHQADGSGVPGMHPPLGPGSWVGNDPKELIAIMMKGLSGKIEVDEETYNGFMPSQAQLTDEEIADVLSYIRSSFGNNFEPVDAKMVKQVRSGR